MSTGAICVNTLKKDWTPETTFAHVLSVIRCLLIIPFPESSLNDEAGKLFMDSYTEYAKRAKLMADVHGRPFQTGKNEEDDEKYLQQILEDPDLIETLVAVMNKHKKLKTVQHIGNTLIYLLATKGSQRTKSSLVWSHAVSAVLKAMSQAHWNWLTMWAILRGPSSSVKCSPLLK